MKRNNKWQCKSIKILQLLFLSCRSCFLYHFKKIHFEKKNLLHDFLFGLVWFAVEICGTVWLDAPLAHTKDLISLTVTQKGKSLFFSLFSPLTIFHIHLRTVSEMHYLSIMIMLYKKKMHTNSFFFFSKNMLKLESFVCDKGRKKHFFFVNRRKIK